MTHDYKRNERPPFVRCLGDDRVAYHWNVHEADSGEVHRHLRRGVMSVLLTSPVLPVVLYATMVS